MSLFTSLSLAKEVSRSRSPMPRLDPDSVSIASSIRYISPRPISDDKPVFDFSINKTSFKSQNFLGIFNNNP